ncbi:hypothetical protein [Candidatus Puniceispirillum sp.]|jgi:hypothetical protein|uniref:hypothetical protein n=1 Tax=Candidatus Puniceispirillum sp. TaxID=2026719 RepID=UPI001ECF1993|nr:hypothetical protein [Candidatus Puniceispirillum sp.]MBT6565953.1 hypothetical protein [Candidatus Puniceispirillum sp.]
MKQRYIGKNIVAFMLALSTLIMVAVVPAQAETRWVSDVPIMEELDIVVDLGFSFDSPNGRIIGIFATSTADAAKVKGFYDEALEALGWARQNESWYRGSEMISLTRADTSFGIVWRLMVQPR